MSLGLCALGLVRAAAAWGLDRWIRPANLAQTTGSLSPTGYYGLVMGFVGTFY